MNKSKTLITLFLVVLISCEASSQPEPIRVACVGNSITEGISLTNPAMDSYPADLGRFLGTGYSVKNFGKSGRTMLKKGDFPLWNEQIFSDAISFDPNIVIIMLGTNDSKPQNWIYKDEFLKDYCAMIDTFKQGHSIPEIYVCYPLPAFSAAYDISDTIIANDIIPIIEHIVDSLDVKLIDFYSVFRDKSSLLPDGIHPLIEGSELMAKVVYEVLTGNKIELQNDFSIAFNKKAMQNGEEIPVLVDNDELTFASFTSGSSPVVIDLLTQYNIDMAGILIPSSFSLFSFSFFISKDLQEWTSIADTSIESSAEGKFITIKFAPSEIRYVKLEIPDNGIPEDSAVFVSEIKVFQSKAFHAPSLRSDVVFSSSTSHRIKLSVSMTSKTGELVKIYKQSFDGAPFEMAYNYRSNDPWELMLVLPFGSVNRFYAIAYYNGAEVQSDTITITSTSPTDVGDNFITIPSGYQLSQNYPNPFNPETNIEFSIPKSEVITIEIFDTSGKLMQTIGSYMFSAGSHRIKWNGKNSDGSVSASGVYFYRMSANDKIIENKKMLLLR